MLTAILHGKAGRIQLQGEETRVRWREVFQRSEDLLSSVFFSRLRYLSPHSTTRVMASLMNEKAATTLGELQKITFWPSLEGTHGRSRVEPDVHMQFANAVVMVEVKPPFGGLQRLEQWHAQIHALAQTLAEEGAALQRVHFIGLGNNTLQLDAQTLAALEAPDTVTLAVHQAEWSDITQALHSWHLDAMASDRAIFDDWRDAFALFGMAMPPAFQWSDLVAWAAHHPLSTTEILCAVGSTPSLAAPIHTPAPAPSDHSPAGCIDWSDLFSFSLTHPLNPS